MPAIRKCAACGNNSLVSSMGIYKAVRPYQCTECGAELRLTPIAMLGMQLSILVAFSLAGLSWIIFFVGESKILVNILVVFFVWLFLSVTSIWVIIYKIKKHYQNPIAFDEQGNVLQSENKGIKPETNWQGDSWIEGKSLIFGLMSPIIAIVIILGIIALLFYLDG